MKDLHWLKNPGGIQFKVLATIYQWVNGLTPPFLIDLLDLNLMRRNLRSDSQGKLPILGEISHKYATVQSDMLDQDYGMNCHKI